MLRAVGVLILLLGVGAAMMPGTRPAPVVLTTSPAPTPGPAFARAPAQTRASVAAPAPAPTAWPQGAARVIDGDSLVVDGVEVRLHGIDAPETTARCTGADGRSYRCGRTATEAAQALIGTQPVTCRDLGERTRDRVVAQCFVGGQDIAATLIAQGSVLSCPRYAANHPHAAGYLALERQAAAARHGLHAGVAPARARYCGTGAAPTAPQLPIPASAGACEIKGNINRRGERIYHLPGQRNYDDTVITASRGERWFCSEAEAQAAGWRQALR